jgi:group I intron endonuclease
LSKRLKNYFNPSYLKKNNNYIARALLLHKYPAFSLIILEYIDITNLSKEDTLQLILEREQHYLDTLNPNYNLNPTAGSRLGSKHSAETRAKMSLAKNKRVFIYSFDSLSNKKTLHKSFDNCSEVSLHFKCGLRTLSRYIDKNKLFRKEWILSTSLISKE